MASKLDRDLQKRILEAAEDAYPNAIPGIEASFLKTDQDLLFANGTCKQKIPTLGFFTYNAISGFIMGD